MNAITPIMSETEAARILGTTKKTLQCWRFERRGPKYLKIGRSVRYRLEDLEEFLHERLIEPVGGRI